MDEVEVETGFETFMVVKSPCPDVSKDAGIVATFFLEKSFVTPNRLSDFAGELSFSGASLDSFWFLIGFGLRNDARQLPHKCGQKMITNNSYHERRKKSEQTNNQSHKLKEVMRKNGKRRSKICSRVR